MAYFNYRSLRAEADELLEAQREPATKLVRLYAGVLCGVSAAVALLTYLSTSGVAGTGGLSGIGTRAVFETVLSVAGLAQIIFLPLWFAGYLAGVVGAVRKWPTGPRALRWGLYRWGVVLRTMLLQAVICVGMMLAGMLIGMMVFTLTPAAEGITELAVYMQINGIDDVEILINNPLYRDVAMSMLPFLAIGMALFVVPMYYRLRFAEYVLVAAPEQGAARAVRGSFRVTKKHCFALFRLDLRFWWYYLAQALIVLVTMIVPLLTLANVDLGGQEVLLTFITALVASACEYLLYTWRMNTVYAVYALAYVQMAMDMQPNNPASAVVRTPGYNQ